MIQLQLISSGEYLDLDEQVQIPLRIIFPAFAQEAGDNTHSLQFDLPATAHNIRQLSHAYRVHTYSPILTHEVRVLVDHFPLMRGTLITYSANFRGQRIAATFEADLSVIAQDLNDTKLRDIDLGGVRVIGSAAISSLEVSMTINDPNGVALIEVNGATAYVILNPGLDQEDIFISLASQITGAANQATASVSGSGAGATMTITATSGDLLVDFREASNAVSYTDLGGGSGSAIHANILAHMLATYTDPIGDHDYQFFPVSNPDFYDGQNSDYLEYVNLFDYDTGTFVANSSAAGEAWRNTSVPFPRVQYLFQQVLAHFGLSDQTDYLALPYFSQLCLWNNVSLDLEGDDGGGAFNQFKSSFNLADHVPDWSCAELIRQLIGLFNLSFHVDWEKKEASLSPRKNLISQPPTDWSDRCAAKNGSLTRLNPKQQGLRFSWSDAEEDRFWDAEHPMIEEFQVQAGGTAISGKMPPMIPADRTAPGKVGEEWAIPRIFSVGKTVFPDVDDPGFTPRLVFFLGEGEVYTTAGAATGKDYPFATSMQKDKFGNVLTPFSLTWSTVLGYADTGLYEFWHEPWLSGREDQPELSTEVYLNLRELLNRPIHHPVWLRNETGPYPVALKEIRATITQRGISSAQLTALRL